MSDRKRPLESTGSDVSSKKFKSDTTPTSNGPSTGGAVLDPEYFAKKRAEITAKAAAMLKSNPALQAVKRPTSVAAPIPRVPVVPASDPSKVVYAATPSPSISSGPTPATSMTPASGTPAGASDDFNRRIAEARRLVADAKTKLAVKDNPYMSLAMASKKKGGTPAVEQTQQGAGLKMAAHPLLLDQTPVVSQSKKDRYKPMQPKFASIKANVRQQPSPTPAPAPVATPNPAANPYSVASSSANKEGTGFEGAPRERSGRKFHFNPKGKYVALANQIRQDQQLEALKQRIAESARKAGLDGDIGIEKAIKRPNPPASEWWDATLLPNKRYEDIDSFGLENLNIRNEESPINIYVQHPIPIPAPAEKNQTELKPMKLTTKEQKKMRKLKRKQELQDKRDRIRMGLLPPDPPKVRLANLMKVLTSDAIQDPTRVEARVRREVALRRHTHEKMNAERKLTDDQRRDKKEIKKLEEEKKGIFGAVFKVLTLSDPSHQFKVRKNAEQFNLTGVCIFNPTFNIVYVEGAGKHTRNFKRLMLHRIAWTERARSRGGGDDVELENPDSDMEGEQGGATVAGSGGPAGKGKARATDTDGVEKSLEDNKCYLIWEGALRDREYNSFRAKSCPTDRDAKEFLGEKLKGYWDVAKNWKPEEEELY